MKIVNILRLIKRFFFIGVPIIALASVSIPAWSMLLNFMELNLSGILIIMPWYLGVLCLPFYSYVVLFDIHKSTVSGIKLKLIQCSLIGGMIASIGGLPAIFAIFPAPFVVVSIVCSILVYRDFNRGNRSQ